jgi:predicted permease
MTRFLIQGEPPLAPGTFPFAQMRIVSPGFFNTMGLGLRNGRLFEQKDINSTTGAFIVNQAFAERYLSKRNPVGSNILLGVMSKTPATIPVIGVVANAHDLGVDADPQPELYLPGYTLHGDLLVRSTLSPQNLVLTLRNAVRTLDPHQPIYNVQTFDALLSDSLARQRMTAVLLGMFAVIALILAAIGIYGVLAYSVTQRTREIGVRMAVGANRRDIVSLVLSQAGRYVALGIVAGLATAVAAARLIDGLLFHTSTIDPIAIATTIGGLILIAALAVSIPARRAASISPTEALRAE